MPESNETDPEITAPEPEPEPEPERKESAYTPVALGSMGSGWGGMGPFK